MRKAIVFLAIVICACGFADCLGQVRAYDYHRSIKGSWYGAGNNRLIVTDKKWITYNANLELWDTTTYALNKKGDTISVKFWKRKDYFCTRSYRVELLDSNNLVLDDLGFSDEMLHDYRKPEFYEKQHTDPPVYKTGTPDTGKVWSGKKLLDVSPVAYYYDLVSKDTLLTNGNCPEVVYVPAWEALVVDENERGERSEIIVNDSDDDKEQEYNNYIRTHNDEISVTNDGDMLTIGHDPGGRFPYTMTYVKLFYCTDGVPLLGIGYFIFNGGTGGTSNTYYDFYKLNNGQFVKATDEVLPRPQTQQFFTKEVDKAFMEKISMEADIEFGASDVILVRGYDANGYCDEGDDVIANKPTAEEEKKRKHVCNIYASKKAPLYYKLDKKSMQFKWLVPTSPLKKTLR